MLLITGGLGLDGAGAWRDDLVASPGSDTVPDLSTAARVLVECRWEDPFASWIARLAALLPGAPWAWTTTASCGRRRASVRRLCGCEGGCSSSGRSATLRTLRANGPPPA